MPEVFPAAPGREGPGGDAALEVGDLIASVSRRIRRAANRDLGPLGITWSQLRALRTVAGSGGTVRMSVLANRLGIARRSATSVVDDLVALGLVERRADPNDRRAVDVAVTPKGHRLLRRLQDRRRSAAREVTAALSPADLAQLTALLQRLDQDPRSS